MEGERGSGELSTLHKGKDQNACASVDWEREAECTGNIQAAEPC